MQMRSKWRAFLFSATFTLWSYFMMFSWGRALFKRYGPRQGTGPSEAEMVKGFFRLTANARSADGQATASASIEGNGDPGYSLTGKLLHSPNQT